MNKAQRYKRLPEFVWAIQITSEDMVPNFIKEDFSYEIGDYMIHWKMTEVNPSLEKTCLKRILRKYTRGKTHEIYTNQAAG